MFGGRFLNARYVNLSRRLINLANYSESNDILSLHSYFQSKGGTFFETTRMSQGLALKACGMKRIIV